MYDFTIGSNVMYDFTIGSNVMYDFTIGSDLLDSPGFLEFVLGTITLRKFSSWKSH